MPYLYAPIVTAIVLYPEARTTLSMRVTTPFTNWITANPDLQLTLPPRISGMLPIVNEGLLFALSHNVIAITGALLSTGSVGPTKAIKSDSTDLTDAQRAAVYLGRWLTRAGPPSTVCGMLGITP